jgi:uncharacterized protein (DUF952 family)
MNEEIIYHITSEEQWHHAQQLGYCTAPSLYTEGFIHCSLKAQLAGVVQRYYQGHNNFIILQINTKALKAVLQYDNAPSINELFPHIYGTINIEAVVATHPASFAQ